MAKKLLLFALCLASLSLARGTENLIDQFRRSSCVDEDKPLIDAMSPAEINAQTDAEGHTALFYSRHQGTTLLLLAGADANTRARDGRTPAFRAAGRSSDPAFPIMLELLALAHTDVNAHDHDGFTLLAWAAHEDNLSAVRLLLLLGADPAPTDVPGNQTPLFFALQNQDDKMAELLRAAANPSAAADAPPGPALVAAARAARLRAVSDALAAGADVNARDADGATALYRAVADRRAGVAALLLLHGANPNLAKPDGKTPLMQCVTGFDMESERMLMELILAGADVNAVAKDGNTALSSAVRARNNTAAQWLIWRHADLDVHAPDGTLMQIATLSRDWPSMIELLKGTGLREQEPLAVKEKSFVLISAVRAGDPAAVAAELARGTPVDATNRYDQTALEWAACYDRFDLVDLLLKHGADINHQHGYNGKSLIHQFAYKKGEGTADAAAKMQHLIDRGANPNLLMHDGCTPLMVAAREGCMGPGLDLLLAVTTDLNARDKDGHTALALARQHGYAGTVKLLQARGAVE